MAGNAVLRMVPSSVCMKKAMATIQGSRRAVLGSSRVGLVMLFSWSVRSTLGRRSSPGNCGLPTCKQVSEVVLRWGDWHIAPQGLRTASCAG